VAADEEGREFKAPTHVERAHALRRVKLVAGDGQEVYLGGGQVKGYFAHGLDGVGVEGDAPFGAGFGHFGYREDDPGLVVGPQESGQGRIRGQGFQELVPQ